MNIQTKLNRLFDYQKFEQNSKLQKIILNNNLESINSLCDDDLSFIAAAGNITCERNLPDFQR